MSFSKADKFYKESFNKKNLLQDNGYCQMEIIMKVTSRMINHLEKVSGQHLKELLLMWSIHNKKLIKKSIRKRLLLKMISLTD